jgi:hypothetical protein
MAVYRAARFPDRAAAKALAVNYDDRSGTGKLKRGRVMKKFLIASVAATLVAAAMLATPSTAQAWGYGRGHPAYGAWGYGALAAPYQYFPYPSYPDYTPYPYYYYQHYGYGAGYAAGCGCY